MTEPDPSRARWRTSSHSGANGSCIQVARRKADISVRDSNDPDGPELAFTPRQWAAFTAAVKTVNSIPGIRLLPGRADHGPPPGSCCNPGPAPAAIPG